MGDDAPRAARLLDEALRLPDDAPRAARLPDDALRLPDHGPSGGGQVV